MTKTSLKALVGLLVAICTPPPSSSAQDASASAGQTATLSDGFTPDPQTITLNANEGGVDASALSSGCSGAIAEAPDLRLSYTAGAHPLVVALIGASHAMLLRDPSGRWYCAGGDGPALRFGRPESGDYLVWVGDNGSGAQVTISTASSN